MLITGINTVVVEVRSNGGAEAKIGHITIDNTGAMPNSVKCTPTPTPTPIPAKLPLGHIAFSSDRDGNYEIYVMNADGSDQTRLTINEDKNGLCEVFTTIGKAGGNAAAQSEAISRLISLSLRSGLDPNAIVRQLKGISGPNPTWEDGRLILSTPDAIGKALDDYIKEREEMNQKGQSEQPLEKPLITLAQDHQEENELIICTKCHNHSVVNEGGCLTCRECGWSKCD